MLRPTRFAAAAAVSCLVASAGCGGSNDAAIFDGDSGVLGDSSLGSDSSLDSKTESSGDSQTGGDSTTNGDGSACRMVGEACAGNGDCCTASCDAQLKVCAQSFGSCRAPGSSCTIPQDCCTFVCSGGTCGATQCTSDNQACADSAACCSGTCNAGACVPLNPSCRTAGNTCAQHGDCCSKVCRNGLCAGAASFCTQNSDVCASDFECCGGICAKAQGATLGLCGQPHATGASGCTLAGQLCGAGAASDGGVTVNDAGVPACGGECCSRACAPYRTGVLVCQPPSGCRPTGETCRGDADCCGFNGEKGVTGVGNCSKASPSDPVGRCDNGNACRPAGAICKLATVSCNAENNCCAGNVNQNPFVCQQDILGIPRCTILGESCADAGSKAGQTCATSADCCGLPCVPNPSFDADAGANAGAPFVCGDVCVGNGGSCTTAADCCPGLPCAATPGSSHGTCGAPPPADAGVTDGLVPPNDATTGDAGTGDAGVADGTVPVPDAPPACAEYGQICGASSDCCNGIPCVGGRCVIIR